MSGSARSPSEPAGGRDSVVVTTILRRLALVTASIALVAAACGDGGTEINVSPLFDGCDNGAKSVITFLQRSLDDIGEAGPGDLAAYADRFDFGVNALLLRAQEMHCTEGGFNDAVMARADELEPNGVVGDLLLTRVREIGIGSLDAARGGPLVLPGQ